MPEKLTYYQVIQKDHFMLQNFLLFSLFFIDLTLQYYPDSRDVD